MKEVRCAVGEDGITVRLSGRIDSNNSHAVEEEIMNAIPAGRALPVTLDASELQYVSSAGLRVILRVKKTCPDLKITNVSTDVYDILEMTGFTEMMTVEKAYRTVSVAGCEEIGRGANGTIYRIDRDNVVKVYNNADALADIQHEREVAKLALILGIPTAISYDVVRVGESYGSVFELLNARSFSKILSDEPDKFDWCVKEYVGMLKKIHSTEVPAGKLPDMKETAVSWAAFMQDHLPAEYGKKLLSLVRAVPHDDHMIHGDYHTKNLELQGDEVLIIDMDTLAVGHPVFELASMYNAFVGFSEADHGVIRKFQGFDFDTGCAFWRASLSSYLGTDDPVKIREVEDKARIIGYTRLIRRGIRRGGLETEAGAEEIKLWTKELTELLDRVDSLTFTPYVLEVAAETDELPRVISFIGRHLEQAGCSPRTAAQMSVAAEEIFVNIASYAYDGGKGTATVRADVKDGVFTLTFTDSGRMFDPTKARDPDVTLPADERGTGGLGIFMTKKITDEVRYERDGEKNVLTLIKKI